MWTSPTEQTSGIWMTRPDDGGTERPWSEIFLTADSHGSLNLQDIPGCGFEH